jgi:hypothetical protein
MKLAAGALLAVVACVTVAGCAASPQVLPTLCAPHDATCQARQAALQDESCKNGRGSNQKCLDPNAPP